MPAVFNTEQAVTDVYNKCLSVELPTTKQVIIDELANLLSKRLNVKIIYALKKYKGKECLVFGCSEATREYMFTLYIHSLQYGLVDKVKFLVHPSIEVMYQYVLQGVKNLKSTDGEVLEALDEEEIESMFVL